MVAVAHSKHQRCLAEQVVLGVEVLHFGQLMAIVHDLHVIRTLHAVAGDVTAIHAQIEVVELFPLIFHFLKLLDDLLFRIINKQHDVWAFQQSVLTNLHSWW